MFKLHKPHLSGSIHSGHFMVSRLDDDDDDDDDDQGKDPVDDSSESERDNANSVEIDVNNPDEHHQIDIVNYSHGGPGSLVADGAHSSSSGLNLDLSKSKQDDVRRDCAGGGAGAIRNHHSRLHGHNRHGHHNNHHHSNHLGASHSTAIIGQRAIDGEHLTSWNDLDKPLGGKHSSKHQHQYLTYYTSLATERCAQSSSLHRNNVPPMLAPQRINDSASSSKSGLAPSQHYLQQPQHQQQQQQQQQPSQQQQLTAATSVLSNSLQNQGQLHNHHHHHQSYHRHHQIANLFAADHQHHQHQHEKDLLARGINSQLNQLHQHHQHIQDQGHLTSNQLIQLQSLQQQQNFQQFQHQLHGQHLQQYYGQPGPDSVYPHHQYHHHHHHHHQHAVTIDTSLTKLLECMSLYYSSKLTSPKWKSFKGLKLRLKYKIRLNNLIWRAWFLQCIRGRRPPGCQFTAPVETDVHKKSETIVLEGKYWKRKEKAIVDEYKKWRIFHKQKSQMSCFRPSSFDWDSRIASSSSSSGPESYHFCPDYDMNIAYNLDDLPPMIEEIDTREVVDTLYYSQNQNQNIQATQPQTIRMIEQQQLTTTHQDQQQHLHQQDLLQQQNQLPQYQNHFQQQQQLPLPSQQLNLTTTSSQILHQQQAIVLKREQPILNQLHLQQQPSLSSPLSAPVTHIQQPQHQPMQQQLVAQTDQQNSPQQSHDNTIQQIQQQQQQPQQPQQQIYQQRSPTIASENNNHLYQQLINSQPVLTGPNSQLDSPPVRQEQATIQPALDQLSAHSQQPQEQQHHMQQQPQQQLLMSVNPEFYTNNNSNGGSIGQGDLIIGGQRNEQRRVCHINAEQKRRCNIKNGFDTLKSILPSINQNVNVKISKASMLQKAAIYINTLTGEEKQLIEEKFILKQQIDSLKNTINSYQCQLPATGGPIGGSCQGSQQARKLLQDYIKTRTLDNWKFWIFSLIIEPLFESYYQSVSTTNLEDSCKTIFTWLDRNCGLVSLRKEVLESLTFLSTRTNILNNPQTLPTEAVDAVRYPPPPSQPAQQQNQIQLHHQLQQQTTSASIDGNLYMLHNNE